MTELVEVLLLGEVEIRSLSLLKCYVFVFMK